MYNYIHETLGPVQMRPTRGGRRFVARWKPGYLYLSVPTAATLQQAVQALDEMAPRLLKLRPVQRQWFADGMVIDCGDLKIHYKANPNLDHLCGYRFVKTTPPVYEALLQYSADADLSDPQILKLLSRMSLKVMYHAANMVLPDVVEGVFSRLGVRPRSWSVSRGQRILGTCRRDGEIHISCAVMMLPPRLREFIVCHEVAHLTHHDHSPAFHALVNRYTDGREKELNSELRAFRWPLPRM